jgi:Family of unknown function (DUF6282)
MGSFPFFRRRFTKGCCQCGHAGTPGGHNRREFLKTAAAAAGVFEVAGMAPLLEAACGQDRNFPPPPPAVSPIEGLTDTHLHSGPDAFGRAMDDEEALQLYKDRGMGAVVLKNHVVPTADRAWFARNHVAGIKVFGGVVLNSAVGGINPDAVSWMWRMQGGYGRFVWFPTFDSDNHVKHFKDAPEGIKVLDEGGKLLPAVYDVLKICAKQKLVVNTGHLSPAECLAVIVAARDTGADRIIVTHAQSEVPNMSLEDMKKAAAMGARLELIAQGRLAGPRAHLEWMRSWRQIRIQETADAIKAIGAGNFVLGTDLRQTGNPTPADGLQLFVSELMAQGITMDQVKLMGREVPGALLMG